jgi:hypothetical protein
MLFVVDDALEALGGVHHSGRTCTPEALKPANCC